MFIVLPRTKLCFLFKYGNDIYFFEEKYPNSFLINPSDLIFETQSNSIKFRLRNGNEITINQFIFELHQDEILSLPKDILNKILKSCKYFNDLRTIFIAHDKRLLTILSRDDILSDYLDPYYHGIIKKHRIYSVLPSLVSKNDKIIIENKNNWLIKPCLLGKGKGIVFGKDCSASQWANIFKKCLNESRNEFIFQEYIQQEYFDYTDVNESGIECRKQKVVGTLLCFNDVFMGPGIFRTSPTDLIALRQDGSLMFPLLMDGKVVLNQKKMDNLRKMNGLSHITNSECFINEPAEYKNHRLLKLPESVIFQRSKISFKDVELYENALVQYGVVLINMEFEDQSSNFMFDLVKHLGLPQAHSSKGNDYLWDIKVLPKGNLSKTDARSHADSEFLMHTDASFENNINVPRFFGLHVIKNDKFKGGQSLLIKLDDILDSLTDSEIKILCNEKLKFKIPVEFRKVNNIDFNVGSILGYDGLNRAICRYRKDIIVNRDLLERDLKFALDKFENLIDIEKSSHVKYCQLKSNSILLVDNCRYLHGRTEIKDSKRHLRRIRFQAKYNELLPKF